MINCQSHQVKSAVQLASTDCIESQKLRSTKRRKRKGFRSGIVVAEPKKKSEGEMASLLGAANVEDEMDARENEETPLLSGEDGMHKNNLGVINGVLVPCLLNIMGIILFLRLGWAVSHAGVLGVVLMLVIGESVAMLTVLSMSAVVSNGNMRGGGSYFLLSRSLGPELGGSIGLLFYLAYAIMLCFNTIGVAEEIVTSFMQVEDPQEKRLYMVLWATVTLVLVMGVGIIGAGFFSKVNTMVFLIQFGSIILGLFCMLFANPIPHLENGGSFVGSNSQTLKQNLHANYTFDEKCGNEDCSFRSVLSVIWPAFTGIMEGANLSGDLQNPNRDIGRGTIVAVSVATLTYMLLIFSFASGFDRETLKVNMNVMENVSWPNKYPIIVGIVISSFSSALGSIFGASRILQALARDDLFPLRYFAKGTTKGDEPRRAVLVTYILAQLGCLVGDLDAVAPVIASFFLVSYACVNLTCLLLEISGTPNFRPAFRFYSRYQSGAGFLLCVGVLFYLDTTHAVIALVALLSLFIYISYNSPAKTWGDVSQSVIFHQVRKYLLKLDKEEHLKNWRPNMIALCPQEAVDDGVLQISNLIKKGGLFLIGSVFEGKFELGRIAAIRDFWASKASQLNLKCIPEVTCAENMRSGFQQLVLLAGVGGMRPNLVCVGMPFGITVDQAGSFVPIVRDVEKLFQKNLILPMNFDDALWLEARKNDWIDVWILGKDLTLDGTLSLKLQLAHILRLERARRNTAIRLLNIVDEYCEIEPQRQRLTDLAARARLYQTGCHVIAMDGLKTMEFLLSDQVMLEGVNSILCANSRSNTMVSFLKLPDLPSQESKSFDKAYMRGLTDLVRNLGPVLLTKSGRMGSIIPEDL